jgi:hypothetical protein
MSSSLGLLGEGTLMRRIAPHPGFTVASDNNGRKLGAETYRSAVYDPSLTLKVEVTPGLLSSQDCTLGSCYSPSCQDWHLRPLLLVW